MSYSSLYLESSATSDEDVSTWLDPGVIPPSDLGKHLVLKNGKKTRSADYCEQTPWMSTQLRDIAQHLSAVGHYLILQRCSRAQAWYAESLLSDSMLEVLLPLS